MIKMRTLFTLSFVFSFFLSQAQLDNPVCEEPPFWVNKPYVFQWPVPQLSDSSLTTGWVIFPQFSDEFLSGAMPTAIDTNKWVAIDGCHSMSPKAYFSSDISNVYMSDGYLHLKAHPDVGLSCDKDTIIDTIVYNSSGFIKSKYKVQYGYIEVKCNFPKDVLLESSIWADGGTWAGGANGRFIDKDEIDIMETRRDLIGSPFDFTHNFCHNLFLEDTVDVRQGITQMREFITPYANHEFIFGVEWFPKQIYIYLNGKVSAAFKYTTDQSVIDLRKNFGPCVEYSEFTCVDLDSTIAMLIRLSLSLRKDSADLRYPFNIDYVRTYKLQDGLDDYWPVSFDLTDNELFKVHENLQLAGDSTHSAIVPARNNISLWATNSIVLDKGFLLTPGSNFTARIIEDHPQLYNITSPIRLTEYGK